MSSSSESARLVSVPVAALSSAWEAFGGGADAAAQLREMGRACGGTLLEVLRVRATAARGVVEIGALDADAFWEEVRVMLDRLGWGSVEMERLHDGIIALSSEDWFEATRSEAPHPSCHFSLGALAELLRQVADEELAAVEVECAAAGGSRCRFLFGSTPAVTALFDELRGGADLESALSALS